MAKSLISIIVPCYLQAQYMDEALQSVLDQTYSNWECIIVNDGSPDNTEEVAHEWLEKDARFKYIYKQNGGLSSARNLGIEKAIGNYIQFLDSDDVLLPSKIEDSIAKINLFKEEKFKLVISNFRMFVDDKNVTQEPYCLLKNEYFTLENVLYNWEEKFTIPIHCGFFEASLFEKLKFNEKLKAKEDWLMWVNIFLNNKFSIFINQPLVLYRN